MKNKIEDLRNHLFAQIEDLRDPDKEVDMARAKLIAETASVIIDSAKAENDFLRITGAVEGSGFIPEAPRGPPALDGTVTPIRQVGRTPR